MRIIKNFCRENKGVFAYLLVCVIASYGMKLFLYNYSIDTEYIMSRPLEYLNNDYKLGRFSIPTLKYILGHIPFNLVKAKIFTAVMIYVYTLTVVFMIWHIVDGDKSYKAFPYIFIGIFLFHPIWTEQYFFIEQSFEVAFGIWVAILAAAFAIQWIAYKKNICSGILAVILMIWALGTYQAMAPLFICVGISFYILILVKEKKIALKDFIEDIIKFFVILIVSIVLWKSISMLFMKWGGWEESTHISKKIVWGKEPSIAIFKNIILYIGSVVFGKSSMYNIGYLVFSIVVGICFFKQKKEEFIEKLILIISFLALIASPFLLCFLQGSAIDQRAQFMLPFCEAWIAGMAWVCMQKRWQRKMMLGFCIIIAVYELGITNLLWLTAHKMYQEEVAFTKSLNEKIEQAVNSESDQEKIKVIFVGTYHPYLPKWCIYGQCTGYSFYEWSPGNEIGINKRVNMFMDTQGYYYERPTITEYREAQILAEKMPVYPAEGSVIYLDKCIIIKLSKQIYF